MFTDHESITADTNCDVDPTQATGSTYACIQQNLDDIIDHGLRRLPGATPDATRPGVYLWEPVTFDQDDERYEIEILSGGVQQSRGHFIVAVHVSRGNYHVRYALAFDGTGALEPEHSLVRLDKDDSDIARVQVTLAVASAAFALVTPVGGILAVAGAAVYVAGAIAERFGDVTGSALALPQYANLVASRIVEVVEVYFANKHVDTTKQELDTRAGRRDAWNATVMARCAWNDKDGTAWNPPTGAGGPC